MDNKCGFGERLRKIRKQHNLTQKEFGERLGLSLPTINRLEQSDRWPHDDFLVKVMEEFYCNPLWLITGGGVSGTDVDDSLAVRVLARTESDESFRGEILIGLGLKPPGKVKRNKKIHNLLKAQRADWMAIVDRAERSVKGETEEVKQLIEPEIEGYREGIAYLDLLLEVGIGEPAGNDET